MTTRSYVWHTGNACLLDMRQPCGVLCSETIPCRPCISEFMAVSVQALLAKSRCVLALHKCRGWNNRPPVIVHQFAVAAGWALFIFDHRERIYNNGKFFNVRKLLLRNPTCPPNYNWYLHNFRNNSEHS